MPSLSRPHERTKHVEPERDGSVRACSQRKLSERWVTRRPWVKKSLAPGIEGRHRLLDRQDCLTISTRSGSILVGLRLHDLHRQQRPARGRSAIIAERISWCARVERQPQFRRAHSVTVRANYLASPPLVVAYALAGRMTLDLTTSQSEKIATARTCT